jgi:hypothetical protein
LSNGGANEVNFCCRVDERVIVEGRLEVNCGTN